MGFWKYVLGTPRNYALTDQLLEKIGSNLWELIERLRLKKMLVVEKAPMPYN